MWRGIQDEDAFYTDPAVIDDFKRYISTLLNHANVYRHVAYKNDPTILAWETCNELLPPPSWTQTIAGYIKSLDDAYLVMDGSTTITAAALSPGNVDLCATDTNTPWNDTTQPEGAAWYRVRAYNLSGVPGPYSLPYQK